MTNRLIKNTIYGTLAFAFFFLMAYAFTDMGLYTLFGEWAGKSTVTVSVLIPFALSIFFFILWFKKKKR